MKQANQDRGTLLLALVAGLFINGKFQGCSAPLCDFLYSRLFPWCDGLLPALTLS